MQEQLNKFDKFTVTRHGVVLAPLGEAHAETAVMNPSTYRDRDGKLLMVFRSVNPHGRSSSLHLALQTETGWERIGVALKPEASYECNGRDGGEGCEDARVTFVADLDKYVMAYTAYGPAGPRIALAVSEDGYDWTRLGLFKYPGRTRSLEIQDNKNAYIFPNIVLSPSGRWSIAALHRPRIPIAPDGVYDVEAILAQTPDDRPGIWIAYFPVAEVKANIRRLLVVDDTLQVITPDMVSWSTQNQMQLGAGTGVLPTKSGLLSLIHGVIAHVEKGIVPETGRYDQEHWGGIVLLDPRRPHKVRFVGNTACLTPETPEEIGTGRYRNIAFPTALERVDDHKLDIWYGAADTLICKATITFQEPLLK